MVALKRCYLSSNQRRAAVAVVVHSPVIHSASKVCKPSQNRTSKLYCAKVLWKSTNPARGKKALGLSKGSLEAVQEAGKSVKLHQQYLPRRRLQVLPPQLLPRC